MKLNTVIKQPQRFTHQGGKAVHTTAVQQLRRSVMACMLWEDTFYELGQTIAQRIEEEVAAVLRLKNGANSVANIAYEARTAQKLRHVPLLITLSLLRQANAEDRTIVSGLLAAICQRPDEITEFLALYWKDGKRPLAAQVKRGLGMALQSFDSYAVSKYANRPGAVRLRDVLFLTHAKPKDAAQEALWKLLAEDKLTVPDTWESNLSAGADKRATWERLLAERKLGALALLRNLRNMQTAGVALETIAAGLVTMNTERVLPFRFITAARYAPQLEPALEAAMFKCIEGATKLAGRTLLLVDRSGSMNYPISSKSELRRDDAAAALAMLLREICEKVAVMSYSTTATLVPPRRGFALRDVIMQGHGGGTMTQSALEAAAKVGYDRIIVITDEQSDQTISEPLPGTKGYFINVATNKNGIGYGPWVHIDGWSEAVVNYIVQYEAMQQEDMER